MEQCASCHHPLGVGRFCVNCGHPIGSPAVNDDWRTGTAERPALAVPGAPPSPPSSPPPPALAEPPSAYAAPPEPRFPLYADEVGPSGRVPRASAPTHPPPPAPLATPALPAPPLAPEHRVRRRRAALPWLVGALVVLLMAGGGALLLVGGGDDDGDGESAADTSAAEDAEAEPSPPPTTFEPVDPPEATPSAPPRPKAKDLTRRATVTAPQTAPPSQDTSGNTVRYDAELMLDQVSDTAWRMPGDGSGSEIAIVLPRTTAVTRLGLINGYAKRDDGYDGYPSNRRITAVVWTLDDGTEVPQQLTASRRMQTIEVDAVSTTVIRLRIVSVTDPGRGRSGRDFTAISDLRLVGAPG